MQFKASELSTNEFPLIFFKVQILNGPSRKWLEGPSMPTSLAGHCALRHWDGIYVVGSHEIDDLQVYLFNITTSTWTTFESRQDPEGLLIKSRRDFACSFNQDKSRIYVSGGQLENSETTRWLF